MPTLLHCVHDPRRGWCHAAAPLFQAVGDTAPEIELRLHGGGLFAGVTPSLGVQAHTLPCASPTECRQWTVQPPAAGFR
jgi:protein-disulfide isomerase-like protein with CxxC motif